MEKTGINLLILQALNVIFTPSIPVLEPLQLGNPLMNIHGFQGIHGVWHFAGSVVNIWDGFMRQYPDLPHRGAFGVY